MCTILATNPILRWCSCIQEYSDELKTSKSHIEDIVHDFPKSCYSFVVEKQAPFPKQRNRRLIPHFPPLSLGKPQRTIELTTHHTSVKNWHSTVTKEGVYGLPGYFWVISLWPHFNLNKSLPPSNNIKYIFLQGTTLWS